MNNFLSMKIKAISINESFARSAVASFALSLNPTLAEINDIKTAVSEAVTNCIVHAYDGQENAEINIGCSIDGNKLVIIISDSGKGIENIEEAQTPFFTTKPEEERSGMGFTLMKSFMDSMEVTSQIGEGTTVIMTKVIASQKED